MRGKYAPGRDVYCMTGGRAGAGLRHKAMV